MGSMRKLVLWFGAVLLVLGGCSTGSDATDAVTDSSVTTAAATSEVGSTQPTSTAVPASTTIASLEETPDLAVFIAAVDEAMEGTSYEGAALDDPEVFIGVGQLFCELLDDGATIDEVLGEYLDALADEETGVVADDDAMVAGVLLGASIEVLCPQHQLSP